MQNAETVLNVIRQYGIERKPLEKHWSYAENVTIAFMQARPEVSGTMN